MSIVRCNMLKFTSIKLTRHYSKFECKEGQVNSAKKPPILYGDEVSPPVRFVMMTAAHLNIQLDFHPIDLFKSEHKMDAFNQINPLQKVPVLKVDKDVICDSHAIAMYLCETTKSEDLYPGSALARAKINQMLFYNATTLFPIDSFILSEYFCGKMPSGVKVDEWFNSLHYLNTALSVSPWLAGDQMRICDFCCASTISSMETVVNGIKKFVYLKRWMDELEKLPCFEINRRGLERLKYFMSLYKPN
ncbi:glutathione S-transferase 2 isoform X2 [Bombyx mori]|uniref:Uncharacterized protein n=1 Tax=Bombyx mori TaxID=7091 RepID=A0A8R2M604_BOMMO|nr:glutathione S-transferase 2-like isoform X2 [Bombyx mori]